MNESVETMNHTGHRTDALNFEFLKNTINIDKLTGLFGKLQ